MARVPLCLLFLPQVWIPCSDTRSTGHRDPWVHPHSAQHRALSTVVLRRLVSFVHGVCAWARCVHVPCMQAWAVYIVSVLEMCVYMSCANKGCVCRHGPCMYTVVCVFGVCVSIGCVCMGCVYTGGHVCIWAVCVCMGFVNMGLQS